MQPTDWFKQFLDNKQQDGRVLYRYRMSDTEFTDLQEMLEITTLSGVSGITKISAWNAVFVIYAAEWWRRNYDGSAWTWQDILASFSDKTVELDTEQFNLIVESGLKYWQRPLRVINGRSCHLSTIAIEGGFPVKQFNNNDCLNRLFKSAIPQFLRLYNADSCDAMRIIHDSAHQLLQNYQNEQIYAILGDMLCRVAKLKLTYQLNDKQDPIAYLNSQQPDWQAQFPLPVNNQAALTLLNEMIHTAAQTEIFTAVPFRGSRILCDAGVYLSFSLASTVELDKITDSDNFPVQVAVEIVSDTGDSYPVGVALKTTVNHKAVLKMPHCSLPPIQGAAVSSGYKLRFKHLSTLLAEQVLISPIDDDVPWTFAHDNNEWLLIGTASVSTKAKRVRILYAQSLSCNAPDSTELAILDSKKLIEAGGRIVLRDEEQCFCIETEQAQSSPFYYLQGKTLAFTSIPKTVYLGVPELWCVNNETDSRQKIDTPLLAKAVNSVKAVPKALTTQQGVYELRLQDEQGNIQFYQTCALLPENFTLRFLNGRIEIDHSERAYTSCDSPSVTRINATNDGRSIEFNISDTSPDHIDLMLRWSKNNSLILTVPFPIRAEFIDADNNKLSQIAMNQLHGTCLRLLGENQQYTHHITLEFRLMDAALNDSDLYLCDEIHQTSVLLDLPLLDYQQWIQQLLAISHHADSFLRLTVYEQGRELLYADIIRATQIVDNKIANRTRQVHSVNEITNLTDALTIQDDSLRLLFIRHRLKQLCLDFSADDWNWLRALQIDEPLTNNELWTAASLESRVLVTLVCQLDNLFMQRFAAELSVCWELIPVSDWLVIFSRYKNYLAMILNETEVQELLIDRIDKITQLAPAHNIIVQLLKYHLCALIDEELLFMQSEDALPVIAEQLELEQQQLIQLHAEQPWPDFLQTELTEHWQILPSETQNLLNLNAVQQPDAVLRLPILLAHFSLTVMPLSWQQSGVHRFKLRQLKAFDEYWFTTAFTLSLAYLSQQTHYLQALLQETDTMINSDENDLLAEIEQQLALATQEVQDLETDVQSFKGNQEELDALRTENAELIGTIEQLSDMITKRDNALKMLLAEVKNLNAKIREIRSVLQAKQQ